MCGIVGSVGNFSRHAFEEALHRLEHRGPDGYGIWDDSTYHVALGHRRLAIVELSDLGKQPMIDDELVITYNGEIYNHLELKRLLEQYGHVFRSHSDTEVILKAYRQWGHQCLTKFNGMWAFAIWDNHRKTLFLSRDRFGVKPLFYSFSKNGFAFASEMKALALFIDSIAVHEDFEWFKNNIYNYELTDKTLISGIKRFPAGHFAYFTPGDKSLKPTRYWNTLDHIEPCHDSYEKQVENFRALFLDACKIRMRSDVKIGTALSGGLDSSAVAAAMHHLGIQKQDQHVSDIQKDWQNAFVATFTGTELDEREYAEEVVNSLKLKGYFYEINPVKGIEDLDEYLWLFEELFLTSPIPMIEIYKSIKANGVSVSLDGHGADELLSGYGAMILHAIKDTPFNIKNILGITSTYQQAYKIKRSSYQVLIDGFEGRANMLKFYFQQLMGLQKRDPLVKELGFFNATLYNEFHFHILPTLLRNYDRYSMAAGVEVRMPFLDYRLVTYCFSLPWFSKLKGGYTKAILRDAMQPFLSDKIIRRKIKTGFGTPFTHWLKGPWKEFIRDVVSSGSFNNSGLIEPKIVKKTIDDFYANEQASFEDGHTVWKELMPYLWENSFYKKLKHT